jgi:hypothetical protein
MEKKTIVDELRAEVASVQKALNLIVSKIELYEAEMNVKETTQQATILGLKQTIAELQEKMLREKISGELKKEKEVILEEKGELIKEKGESLAEKGELIDEKGEFFEGSGKLIVEKGESLEGKVVESATNSGPSTSSGPELKQPIAASPSRDARVITDLRRAIGLNDRFRFKHDLFADNDQLMAETIDALNQINTMADADAYLKERFAWKADDATVVYFYEMLQRKFI